MCLGEIVYKYVLPAKSIPVWQLASLHSAQKVF